MGELTKKTVKNSIYSVLEFGWPILTSLLATPFIIRKLGIDAFGILALITVVLGFFALLDLGLTSASIKYIAEEYGKKNFERINKIINSTLLVFFIIGSIGALVILSSSNILVTKILHIPQNLTEVTKFAFYLASLGFLLNMINGVFATIPKAVQRYDISTKISIIIGTLTTLSTVLLLYFGFWLRELIILNLIISVISIGIYVVISKKLISKLIIRPSFDKKIFFVLFQYGSLVLVTTLSGLIIFHLDKFLIGSLLSVAMVTFYIIPGNIANKINSLTAAIVNVVLPVSSTLAGTKQIEKLKTLYLKGTKFILIFITAVSIPLLVFSGKFLFYWLGSDFANQSTAVMMILVATYYFLSINSVPWNISFGLGKIKMNAMFSWTIAILNIVLLVILIKPFGIVGAALAYLLSVIIIVPFNIIYIEKRVLKLSGFEFWKIYAKITFVGLLQALVVILLTRFAFDIFSTLGLMIFSILIFPLIYIVLGFFKEEDKELVNTMLSFLKR